LRGRRILLVEDNHDIQAFVSTVARMEGADLVAVTSAEEGLALVQQGEVFDLLILDLNLPQMSGWELLEKVMGVETRPTVVIFTASADPEISQRAINAGAAGVIVKPVGVREFLEQLRRALEGFGRQRDP
jgi:CheY-like chemotaxis protein